MSLVINLKQYDFHIALLRTSSGASRKAVRVQPRSEDTEELVD